MIQSTTAGFHLVEATSARIQIYTFGTLRVVRDHLAVSEGDWHTRQARQLLKILLTERPRPVSTDLLIEILWPNSTPSAAATTLRSAINALRNVLEPDRPNRAPSKYIVTQAPGYAFHTTPDIWLDVEEFERRLNAVQSVVDPGVRLVLLEGAIELYQDDYLISDPYADWLQTERERLRERFFNALLLAAEFYAEMGRYAEAITACRRMLARDEVRENAYQGLMRYQAESGDSAGALLTYERCRSILSDELGADPSPVTQTLHQRILNGEIEPRPVVVSPAHASSLFATESVHLDTTLHAPPVLPARQLMPALDVSHASVFVGRENELAQLEAQIAAVEMGRGGLLILEGEAGIGKTRLAYHGLQHVAEKGLTAISATCQVLERELPFAPLVDGISRYLYGLPDLALRALPAASLAQIVPIIPGLQDRLYSYPVVSVEVAASPEENRLRLIDSIVNFLAALASARPLVLFLDDLQWADPDTLAVISRLSQRLADVPILLLIAYRSEDLSENDALGALLHSLNRVFAQSQLRLAPLNRAQVAELLIMQMGQDEERSRRLADLLHDATHGNALFVTETLRYLEEQGNALGDIAATVPASAGGGGWPQSFSLRRNQRVQETILERTLRLPLDAHSILNLCSVIGRDFSLELLEKASTQDPVNALSTLLQRRFLIERPDERLDFSHQVVRQAVYDNLNLLQRRRLHLAVAEALVDLGQADQNPGEAAFHFGQAGASYRLLAAEYNVLAGEKLLRTYGFRQAVDVFDRALEVLEQTPDAPASFVRRALEGRGLAFESLFDPEGITGTYRRLQAWARHHGDRSVLVATYSRLTTMLGLMGQQHESNVELRELLRALSGGDPYATPSHVLIDLLRRRELIYSQDDGDTEGWQAYVAATRPVAHPVDDLQRVLEPVHAVPPLFDYGWTLLVQGERRISSVGGHGTHPG
ncbi:MAG: AAA family ATPase [Anaerolineales bacterium]|nr:AAA family ATPase [Anaerolineales bacterium]